MRRLEVVVSAVVGVGVAEEEERAVGEGRCDAEAEEGEAADAGCGCGCGGERISEAVSAEVVEAVGGGRLPLPFPLL